MVDTNFSSKKLYILFALLFFIFGAAIALLTSSSNYIINSKESKTQIIANAVAEYKFKHEHMSDFVSHLDRMLLVIGKNMLTQQYLENYGEAERERLSAFLKPAIYSNKDVITLRYIDSEGDERLRIERRSRLNEIVFTPDDQLQNRKQRKYFQKTMAMQKGEIWHSDIDLKTENGAVELPYQPTFRISTPVFYNDEKKGFLILNLDMNNILDYLTDSTNFDIYVFDVEGDILVSPVREQSWTKQLDKNLTISSIFPNYAEYFSSTKQHRDGSFFIYSLSDIFHNGKEIKIMMIPTQSMLKKMQKTNYITAAAIAGIVLLVTFPLSWLVSYFPIRLQSKLLGAFDKIRRYNYIIDSNVATTASDIDGTITDISTHFLRLTGFERNEVVGKKQGFLRHPDTSQDFASSFWMTISSGKIWTGEIKIRKSDNDTLWLQQTVTPEIDKHGNVKGYTSVAQDITDKKRIEELSMRDRLTGLFNRHKLDIVLKTELERFYRYKSNLCALMIDADNFKSINDTFGHQIGDDVLVKMAQLMQENIRKTDFAGRWGGEEFLIIASETNIEQAFIMAEKLRLGIESASFLPVEKFSVSIGVAQYQHGETIAHFINRADEALYHAKQAGRNRTVTAE